MAIPGRVDDSLFLVSSRLDLDCPGSLFEVEATPLSAGVLLTPDVLSKFIPLLEEACGWAAAILARSFSVRPYSSSISISPPPPREPEQGGDGQSVLEGGRARVIGPADTFTSGC